MGSETTDVTTSLQDFRVGLMQGSVMWQDKADELMPVLNEADASDLEKVAATASLMAATYAYTLAAVLGIVENRHGRLAAQQLALEADEILTNGDYDDWNADVTPPAKNPMSKHGHG